MREEGFWARWMGRAHAGAWAALVLLLPLSSLPVLAKLVHTNTVAAASVVPAAWLAVFWLGPYLWGRGKLPGTVVPFVGVLVAAAAASAAAVFLPVPAFKGKTIFGEMGEAWVTLFIGGTFYLLAASWPRDRARLLTTLKLVNVSGLILVGWSLLQGAYILTAQGDFPEWMVAVQKAVSLRKLFFNRITGFAFEPSWLAHQSNMVYLPFWLAATVRGFSAHRLRMGRLTVENGLLAGGLAVLALSFSRVGWLAFLVGGAYLSGLGSIGLGKRLHAWVSNRFRVPASRERWVRLGLSAALSVGFLVLYVGGTFAGVYAASRFDGRVARIFDKMQDAEGFFDLANKLAFAERVIYWATGWEIFNDHPLLGVGLGNAGFYFPEEMPAFGTMLVELNNVFYRRPFLPNTKSLWVRLLAETGIAGFGMFGVWLFVLWRSARAVEARPDPLLQTTALAGKLVMLGLLMEGFSVDSFALPYVWFSLGVLTAGAWIFMRERSG